MITANQRNENMETKKISISAKRQITIPQSFFVELKFGEEAECYIRGNELVIRPSRRIFESDFSAEILRDLLGKGYSDEEIMSRFIKAQKEVRNGVEKMLSDASDAARGIGEFYTMEDVFGE